jgi:hypothetical protein
MPFPRFSSLGQIERLLSRVLFHTNSFHEAIQDNILDSFYQIFQKTGIMCKYIVIPSLQELWLFTYGITGSV